MGALQPLEDKMEELLVKKAPFQIPENGRKALVKYLPIIALVVGILSLLAALSLWRAARSVDDFVNVVNQYSQSLGLNTINYGLVYYLALVALIVQAVLLLMAYKPLKDKQKRGWDLLLFGEVASFAYGITYLFSDSGRIGDFILNVIGVVIGLYLLAQIRSYYVGKKSTEATKAEDKK